MQGRDEFGRAEQVRVEPVTPPMGTRLPAGVPGAQHDGRGFDGAGSASGRAEPVTPPMGTPLPLGGVSSGVTIGGPVLDDVGTPGLIEDVGHAAPAVIGGSDPFDDGRADREWPTLARNRGERPEERLPDDADGTGGSWVGRMFGRREG
ncbi:hypothetical protein FHR81_000856 [Actinoalloteichus hoggarensis]|uniref:Uncharacterized protein n=1 Tax=Actinoalloteichus hoggarensis TaxID=1470176 RepID=A0A221W178_9PSEU|nr:hypothetical protein [Actinoalloteichus hoggarensis]ASO19468.1 hypothetical protein AHOG_09120 [Actinoalloteichus hoggarensis]MBB5919827.1 hypothetical protein [Actinoalloteichus hoggarensis]